MLEDQRNRLVQNMRQQQTNFNSIQSGQKTINNFILMQRESKDQIESKINQTQKLINDITALILVITVHLSEREMPVFKKEKAILYRNMIKKFSALEKNNA